MTDDRQTDHATEKCVGIGGIALRCKSVHFVHSVHFALGYKTTPLGPGYIPIAFIRHEPSRRRNSESTM